MPTSNCGQEYTPRAEHERKTLDGRNELAHLHGSELDTPRKHEWIERHGLRQRCGADGLTLDSEGRLYAACANGVQVFSPQGQRLGTIPMPRPSQNLSFAGADKKTLYVVGRGVASRVAMLARDITERPR